MTRARARGMLATIDRIGSWCARAALALGVAALVWSLITLLGACSRSAPPPRGRTFAAPDDAVKGLIAAVKAGRLDEVQAIFGPDSADLIASSDPATARRNREIFTAAVTERWRLTDQGTDTKLLVVGNEDWPFPIPLVRDAGGWRFDTAAGREEVIARRIGRNELAAIRICRTYVAAQRLYAREGHDGQPAGLFAATVRSDPGRHNGLYWPARRGERRSPLGDLLADAARDGRASDRDGAQPAPLYGYYFRILTAQGAHAPGGAKDYVSAGRLSGGFALVAWPAEYDMTGVMTFIVNADGIVHERDLGTATQAEAPRMTLYDPDASWSAVQ